MEKHEHMVRGLLSGIHTLIENQFMQGKYEATDTIVDLGNAVKLADLTDRQRESIRLTYVEKLKQTEVAAELGIPRQNVSYHNDLAIQKIADVYEMWEGVR